MQVLRYTHPLCHFWFVNVCLEHRNGEMSIINQRWLRAGGGGGVVGVLPQVYQ